MPHRTSDDRKPRAQTLPQQGETQQRVPREPHEHDESADSQAPGEPSGERMANAAREDVERGLVDADKGPMLEETYEKQRAGTPPPRDKFSP
jgi:hypothetical protein